MLNISLFDLFKVGIGPSSSHTVGPMVAAKRFLDRLHAQANLALIARIEVTLYGSLAATGPGHGTVNAVLMGLMGEIPATVDIDLYESRIKQITRDKQLMLAGQYTIAFDIERDIILRASERLPKHTNGMRFRAFDAEGASQFVESYYSIGGGFVVDADQDINAEPQNPLPYPFSSAGELLALCEQYSLSIAELMLANEQALAPEKDIDAQLDALWDMMKASIQRGCSREGWLPGHLRVRRRAKTLSDVLHSARDQPSDPLITLDWVTLFALAVNEENASGGRIVTAPTNGAAGIIPAVLHYYERFVEGATPEGIREFLLTTAAIGILFKRNASISGAEVGCQGEIGSACSMAAAGLTAVTGGHPGQIENAAEIAMEHHLGLTCDPIGGLVQIPCIERNAVASVTAIHASRIAMKGSGDHKVSLDTVIHTMFTTGQDMLSKYKETARGGLAKHAAPARPVAIPVNVIDC